MTRNPSTEDSGRRRHARRLPGRPRDAGAQAAILEATREVAQETDYRKISIEMIARRAQAAKTTIYRWWPNKATLIYEALFHEELPCPDTGSLEVDLREWLATYASAYFASDRRHVCMAMWADLKALDPKKNMEHQVPMHQKIQEVLDRALLRGELKEPQNGQLVHAMLVGGLANHCLICGLDPDPPHLAAMVRTLIQGLSH
ncbi:MAG: TetR/AcrR family transcriptional regulator [Planctomycetota bacterium]